ncbi:hypothetical protein PMIN02_006784 [Paraphaeosphaeria minitans]
MDTAVWEVAGRQAGRQGLDSQVGQRARVLLFSANTAGRTSQAATTTVVVAVVVAVVVFVLVCPTTPSPFRSATLDLDPRRSTHRRRLACRAVDSNQGAPLPPHTPLGRPLHAPAYEQCVPSTNVDAAVAVPVARTSAGSGCRVTRGERRTTGARLLLSSRSVGTKTMRLLA